MNKISIQKNGCTQQPTLHQLITYILYFPNLLICFFLISLLDYFAIHFSILGILTLISLFSSAKATLSHPTDKFIIKQYQTHLQGQNFDHASYKLESFCEICDAYVQEHTKHCKNCNRCCQGFDHHCKWINNCVGNLNYNLFLLMITSTLLLFMYTTFIYIYIIVLYQTNYETLNIENELQKFHFTQENDLNVKYVLSIIMLGDSAFIVILLLQLLIFHIYLIIKGITTYDFIIKNEYKKILPQFQIGHQMFQSASKNNLKASNEIYGLANKNTTVDVNLNQHKTIPDKPTNQDETIIDNQILT
ncbi:unnamed protein product [Paramecium primaurelia]|uniref:Palmitoyltransferase n=1 Tax=Paramecium primaurelia TaxID=5886 RepID=A0A8S1MJU4_PARPR|nr:unnamed protein product [Paramecium primaurelia]